MNKLILYLMKKIELTEEEIKDLEEFIKKGRRSARALTRTHILLLTHKGKKEETIADMLNICRATISNVKKRYREEGLQSALKEEPRSGQPKKYSKRHEAEIIAQAYTSSPEGRKRWSLVLLTEELRKRKGFETINRETVRLVLKKQNKTLAEKDVVYPGDWCRIQSIHVQGS
jgi:transposase